jgi:GNAT superfamily N-acetyltransferase
VLDEITVRPFEREDGAQVTPFVIGIQRGEFNVPITVEEQPDLVDPIGFFRHGAGNFWVATHGNRIAGTIGLLDIGDGTGVLRKMFVASEYRGARTGVAKRLLDTLIEWASAHDVREIYLGTGEVLRAAHRFCEKNGFEEIGAESLPAAFPRMAVDTKFYRRALS